jgi:SAM-dependent methyltransferase
MTPEEKPRCPITGEPAVRLIQTVSRRLLRDLWRFSCRVDPAQLFAGVRRFALWESPCGLAFFDPPIEGDAAFYRRFYARIGAHDRLDDPCATRPEFALAAAQAAPGALVLDVGGGTGGLSRVLPQGVRYVGLDPNFAGDAPPGVTILAETVQQHAATHAGRYDLVVALQTIEHVADPLGFARALAACAKPGGRVAIGVPTWPCDMTDIPNFAPNAPPHHLSWWREPALRALADRLGLETEAVLEVPLASDTGLLCWMAKLSPRRTEERYFKGSWWWHAALCCAWLGAKPLAAVFGVPQGAKTRELLLVARKDSILA